MDGSAPSDRRHRDGARAAAPLAVGVVGVGTVAIEALGPWRSEDGHCRRG